MRWLVLSKARFDAEAGARGGIVQEEERQHSNWRYICLVIRTPIVRGSRGTPSTVCFRGVPMVLAVREHVAGSRRMQLWSFSSGNDRLKSGMDDICARDGRRAAR